MEYERKKAGTQEAASKPRCSTPNRTVLTDDSFKAGDDAGSGNSSPRMNNETPIPPMIPVSTVFGKYATCPLELLLARSREMNGTPTT